MNVNNGDGGWSTVKSHISWSIFSWWIFLSKLLLFFALNCALPFHSSFLPPPSSPSTFCRSETRIEIRYRILVDRVLMTVTKIPGNLLIFSFSSTTGDTREIRFFPKISSGGTTTFKCLRWWAWNCVTSSTIQKLSLTFFMPFKRRPPFEIFIWNYPAIHHVNVVNVESSKWYFSFHTLKLALVWAEFCPFDSWGSQQKEIWGTRRHAK